MQQDFDQFLRAEWSHRYENERELFRSTLKFIHLRDIPNTAFKAYFNLQLIENKPQTQIVDPSAELVRDFKEEDRNFLSLQPRQILCYVDLENNQIFKANNEENTYQPIILNVAPICSFHSLIIPYLESKLQQVLSGYVADQVLGLFAQSTNESLRIGYNSVLAHCSVNHLHLHLIYADALFKSKFPVETYPVKQIHVTDNFIIGEVQDYPIRTVFLQGKNLADKLQIVIDNLLKDNIPHNILFVNQETAYVFPRKSQFEFVKDHDTKFGFAELSGLIICRNKAFYEKIDNEIVTQKLSELSWDDFDVLVHDILQSIKA